MIYNTRFNPTVNGGLHLGHLYIALVNQGEARAAGGTFGVRFDDTQRYWNWFCGDKAAGYAEDMRKDLEYFGIRADYWITQAEQMEQVDHLLEHEFHYSPAPQPFAPDQGAEVAGSTQVWYPYTERLTAEKVVFDFLNHSNLIIRGVDLLPEDCLYRYFVERFQLPRVKLVYIPRLTFAGEGVSKTEGNYKLSAYRKAGADPQEIKKLLAYNCLTSGSTWRFDNVRPAPVLGAWAGEMLHGVHP